MHEFLPRDWRQALLVGRLHTGEGPTPIAVRAGRVLDVSATAPTVSALLNDWKPSVGGRDLGDLSEFTFHRAWEEGAGQARHRLLAPVDLQCVKAAGVTFAVSAVERVIEERARGDARKAQEFRDALKNRVGQDVRSVRPGSPEAERLKAALIADGLWSQYLEVAIGPDAEIFTKSPVLSSMGWGEFAGVRSDSDWNNPEPEIVVVCNGRGEALGATLGNDVNLRDFEGRSALLLGKAKDNNASCCIGPFIRMFDGTYTMDAVRNAVVELEIEGQEGYRLEGTSSMAEISRDPLDLVRQATSEHQYPDGFALFLGTLFAPTQDRDLPGRGFTHREGDIVRVSTPTLGMLENRVTTSRQAPAWTFGISALMNNLSARGLLSAPGSNPSGASAMTEILTHYIGGERIRAEAMLESLNPSDTRDVVARYPDGGEVEVDAAVAAARMAFPEWAGATPEQRSDLLDRIGDLILSRRDDLGRLLSREEGKTLPEGIGEVARAGRIFKYFAGEALRRHGQYLDSTRPGVEVTTVREPVGVFGLITPWNFPIAIPAWKAAPALAFGNTVVLKAAGPTPAMAAALADIIYEAGAPAGIFNLVLGRGQVGAAIVRHPGVDGISFTGSQAVGGEVASVAAGRQARVQLEMGGKNPMVVLDDADFERAVACCVDGAFFATGQRCTASSRIIVTAGIYDRFVEAFAAAAAALKVGDALDPDTKLGPAVSEQQLEQNLSYVDIAVREGGRLVGKGGERLSLDKPGFYMSPAVIADTRPEMRINCEEVFGPVASVVKADDYDHALRIANAGEFGLSAGICTSSLKHARHFQRNVRAGMVMVNLPTAGVDYHVPFGGSRKSSYGPREQGFAAVEFYTQTKTSYLWA